MARLSVADRDALTRALQQLLHGPDKARAAQVAAMVRESGWEKAAIFASDVCQFAALALKPWEVAPHDADPNTADPPGRFLARMLQAGLSRFEPDPIAAMEGDRIAAGRVPSPTPQAPS